MNNKIDSQWIIYQVIIFLFGLFVSLNGFHIYSDRIYVNSHFRISIDLGDLHVIYGLIIIILGILVCSYALYSTFKKLQ